MSPTNSHSNTYVGQTFDATALPKRLFEIVYLQDHKAIDYVIKVPHGYVIDFTDIRKSPVFIPTLSPVQSPTPAVA